MGRRSTAHSKQLLQGSVDMAAIHRYGDNGSSSLLHPPTEKIIHIQMMQVSKSEQSVKVILSDVEWFRSNVCGGICYVHYLGN